MQYPSKIRKLSPTNKVINCYFLLSKDTEVEAFSREGVGTTLNDKSKAVDGRLCAMYIRGQFKVNRTRTDEGY